MFLMTFSGGRKTSTFRARTDPRRTHVPTYARTHVIALIHPCDSRQSEEGRRTPRASPSSLFSLFLSFFLPLMSLLATVVATQQAGFQTNKAIRGKNARFSTSPTFVTPQ